MEMNGYKLSERAAMAARGERPAPPKKPMSVSPTALAAARLPGAGAEPTLPAEQIYAPFKFDPAMYPDGVAMDSCLPSPVNSVSSWAIASALHEGQGFFGYPYLAELMQRAEYRHAAEIWAEHAVRKWIEIKGGTDEQRKKIEEAFTALNVRDVFQKWIFHDHSFGRGQIFLDFGDADNPRETAKRLLVKDTKINESRPLRALTIVEPMWSAPGTYSTNNPLRADFYRPASWFVYGRRGDATRMLTITSRPVSDMLKPAYAFGGLSLTQMMKPYVDNWLRTRQAVSDMLNSYSVFNLKTDMSSVMGGGGGEDLYRRVDMFNQTRDNRGCMVTDKDAEELENLAVSLSGLDKLQAQSQEQLASVARIPLSIYLQITPTGLNATSDGETRNFYADVHSYQEKNVRPALQTVLECVQLSVLGAINPEIKFQFAPLWEMSEVDKAEIRHKDAQVDVAYTNAGIVAQEEVRERLSNDEESIYHGVDLTDPPPELDKGDDGGGGGKEPGGNGGQSE
jgi:Uncharacterized protein conserved in bacteria